MNHTCNRCHDTGSLSKDVSGYLDCSACGVAEERTKLDQWIDAQRFKHGVSPDAVWTIYQRGKAAAIPAGWKPVPIEPTEAMVHAAEDVPAPRPFGAVYRYYPR